VEGNGLHSEALDPHADPSRLPHDDVEAQLIAIVARRHGQQRVWIDVQNQTAAERRDTFVT
jgi:hypothetical protein